MFLRGISANILLSECETVRFTGLELQGWQQFESININFHPTLTVITGANGAGKTTLLRFLARHFGWNFSSLRTPHQRRGSGFRYITNLLLGNDDQKRHSGGIAVGHIGYSSGRKCIIRIPEQGDQLNYQPTIDQPEQVPGFFLPSHRSDFRYQRVESLPLRRRRWTTDAFEAVQDSIRNASFGSGGYPSVYRMKEILIGLGIFGFPSEVVQPDSEARQLFESFQQILSQILPPDLGFRKLAIRDQAEIVMVTSTGDFLLDAVSGGIAALIETAWQVFMYGSDKHEVFTVVIDEPENHLHASMQRSFMPRLTHAFPNTQFIIATHSPLIVGSLRDSQVYALRYNSDRRVSSDQLDLVEKAGTAEQVLRDVLDVETSVPIWAEQQLDATIRQYIGRELTPEVARALRQTLTEAGLRRWIPEALIRIAEQDQVQ